MGEKRRKKRIAFYITQIGDGGAERVMTNLANQYARRGNRVIFITSYLAENEYPLHENIIRINLDGGKRMRPWLKRNLLRICRLRRILKKGKPDVLISFLREPNIRSMIAALGLPTKTIISIRNNPANAGKADKIMANYILPLADGCVFQTVGARMFFPRRLQDKSRIIPNGINDKFYKMPRNPLEGLIVTCGRLDPAKNHNLLLDVFQELVKRYPQSRLKIYGVGSLRAQLENKIKQANLSDKVFLMGQVVDVPLALSEADVFVLPSDSEGMPNALMEAMAMGIPCVSTDCPCGGPRALIANGVNGILVPVGDKASMLKEVEGLLSNDAAKHAIGQKARETAQDYKMDAVFKVWDEYIEEIVSR